MKLVAAFAILVSTTLTGLTAQAEVLSFKEWKNMQIMRAHQYKNRVDAKIAPSARPRGVTDGRTFQMDHRERARHELRNMASLKLEKEKAEYGLKAARALNLRDYFEIYLNQQKNPKQAIQEVSSKLTDAEKTELLIHYSESLK